MIALALVPLLIVLFVWVAPRFGQARLNREMAILLNTPPALEINTMDREQLLEWSAGRLKGSPTLPAELDKVEFRGAAAINVAAHKAVLLKMKNEQRASLVIVDAPDAGRSFPLNAGRLRQRKPLVRRQAQLRSALQWHRRGLHAYMTKMGIIS